MHKIKGVIMVVIKAITKHKYPSCIPCIQLFLC